MKLKTYLSLCSEYYELDKPKPSADAYEFYESFIKEAKGPVLEPMCGTGRFLIPLVRAGYEIEGYDASPQMLAILKEKATLEGVKPNVWEQFIEYDREDKTYDLIFIPSGSFGLITDDSMIVGSLKKLHQQLNDGGKLVFDAETPSALPEQCNIWHGDIRYRNENTYIAISSLPLLAKSNISSVICRYELVENGKIINSEIEEMNIKHYEHKDLTSRIKRAGFQNINHHCAYKRNTPIKDTDELIVYECTK